ncbi:hypothetical protein CEUSTIGMA_g9708.t1 [Chlamydomonas eustigma]|uniref:Uncharacterized protein n=1 Tax=Chlamydomonas eustigma TaxID=1157962 RepID=A0A250XH84_9CHLO|nr:hypothetical protein CEUSTIGMA_g9708.t1 [Chlamydomonas eustigma]|eukprot:GAX82279.1 hypothetical protein CEUSTIGMA_g9708.t1 [Chlamydomonas eustigma]
MTRDSLRVLMQHQSHVGLSQRHHPQQLPPSNHSGLTSSEGSMFNGHSMSVSMHPQQCQQPVFMMVADGRGGQQLLQVIQQQAAKQPALPLHMAVMQQQQQQLPVIVQAIPQDTPMMEGPHLPGFQNYQPYIMISDPAGSKFKQPYFVPLQTLSSIQPALTTTHCQHHQQDSAAIARLPSAEHALHGGSAAMMLPTAALPPPPPQQQQHPPLTLDKNSCRVSLDAAAKGADGMPADVARRASFSAAAAAGTVGLSTDLVAAATHGGSSTMYPAAHHNHLSTALDPPPAAPPPPQDSSVMAASAVVPLGKTCSSQDGGSAVDMRHCSKQQQQQQAGDEENKQQDPALEDAAEVLASMVGGGGGIKRKRGSRGQPTDNDPEDDSGARPHPPAADPVDPADPTMMKWIAALSRTSHTSVTGKAPNVVARPVTTSPTTVLPPGNVVLPASPLLPLESSRTTAATAATAAVASSASLDASEPYLHVAPSNTSGRHWQQQHVQEQKYITVMTDDTRYSSNVSQQQAQQYVSLPDGQVMAIPAGHQLHLLDMQQQQPIINQTLHQQPIAASSGSGPVGMTSLQNTYDSKAQQQQMPSGQPWPQQVGPLLQQGFLHHHQQQFTILPLGHNQCWRPQDGSLAKRGVSNLLGSMPAAAVAASSLNNQDYADKIQMGELQPLQQQQGEVIVQRPLQQQQQGEVIVQRPLQQQQQGEVIVQRPWQQQQQQGEVIGQRPWQQQQQQALRSRPSLQQGDYSSPSMGIMRDASQPHIPSLNSGQHSGSSHPPLMRISPHSSGSLQHLPSLSATSSLYHRSTSPTRAGSTHHQLVMRPDGQMVSMVEVITHNQGPLVPPPPSSQDSDYPNRTSAGFRSNHNAAAGIRQQQQVPQGFSPLQQQQQQQQQQSMVQVQPSSTGIADTVTQQPQSLSDISGGLKTIPLHQTALRISSSPPLQSSPTPTHAAPASTAVPAAEVTQQQMLAQPPAGWVPSDPTQLYINHASCIQDPDGRIFVEGWKNGKRMLLERVNYVGSTISALTGTSNAPPKVILQQQQQQLSDDLPASASAYHEATGGSSHPHTLSLCSMPSQQDAALSAAAAKHHDQPQPVGPAAPSATHSGGAAAPLAPPSSNVPSSITSSQPANSSGGKLSRQLGESTMGTALLQTSGRHSLHAHATNPTAPAHPSSRAKRLLQKERHDAVVDVHERLHSQAGGHNHAATAAANETASSSMISKPSNKQLKSNSSGGLPASASTRHPAITTSGAGLSSLRGGEQLTTCNGTLSSLRGDLNSSGHKSDSMQQQATAAVTTPAASSVVVAAQGHATTKANPPAVIPAGAASNSIRTGGRTVPTASTRPATSYSTKPPAYTRQPGCVFAAQSRLQGKTSSADDDGTQMLMPWTGRAISRERQLELFCICADVTPDIAMLLPTILQVDCFKYRKDVAIDKSLGPPIIMWLSSETLSHQVLALQKLAAERVGAIVGLDENLDLALSPQVQGSTIILITVLIPKMKSASATPTPSTVVVRSGPPDQSIQSHYVATAAQPPKAPHQLSIPPHPATHQAEVVDLAARSPSEDPVAISSSIDPVASSTSEPLITTYLMLHPPQGPTSRHVAVGIPTTTSKTSQQVEPSVSSLLPSPPIIPLLSPSEHYIKTVMKSTSALEGLLTHIRMQNSGFAGRTSNKAPAATAAAAVALPAASGSSCLPSSVLSATEVAGSALDGAGHQRAAAGSVTTTTTVVADLENGSMPAGDKTSGQEVLKSVDSRAVGGVPPVLDLSAGVAVGGVPPALDLSAGMAVLDLTHHKNSTMRITTPTLDLSTSPSLESQRNCNSGFGSGVLAIRTPHPTTAGSAGVLAIRTPHPTTAGSAGAVDLQLLHNTAESVPADMAADSLSGDTSALTLHQDLQQRQRINASFAAAAVAAAAAVEVAVAGTAPLPIPAAATTVDVAAVAGTPLPIPAAAAVDVVTVAGTLLSTPAAAVTVAGTLLSTPAAAAAVDVVTVAGTLLSTPAAAAAVDVVTVAGILLSTPAAAAPIFIVPAVEARPPIDTSVAAVTDMTIIEAAHEEDYESPGQVVEDYVPPVVAVETTHIQCTAAVPPTVPALEPGRQASMVVVCDDATIMTVLDDGSHAILGTAAAAAAAVAGNLLAPEAGQVVHGAEGIHLSAACGTVPVLDTAAAVIAGQEDAACGTVPVLDTGAAVIAGKEDACYVRPQAACKEGLSPVASVVAVPFKLQMPSVDSTAHSSHQGPVVVPAAAGVNPLEYCCAAGSISVIVVGGDEQHVGLGDDDDENVLPQKGPAGLAAADVHPNKSADAGATLSALIDGAEGRVFPTSAGSCCIIPEVEIEVESRPLDSWQRGPSGKSGERG